MGQHQKVPQSFSDAERTSIYDELFSNEGGTSWVVKSERVPTAKAASELVAHITGEPAAAAGLRRARIEWREGEGWWLTCDDAGDYEVWEVDES
jgi:hypothetical protein